MSATPEDRKAETPGGPEAGVPTDLLELYIDCDLEAQRRGVSVDRVLEEIRALAAGS